MDSSIKFNVSANTAQFQSGMRAVDATAKSTAAGIKQAFAGVQSMLVGGAMVAGLRSLMNDFDRVGKLATRFDTSAESIQRVSVAAQVAGTDVEAVANAMTKAGIAASKALESGGQMADLFQRAGINARDFAAANIDQKLLMIAEAYRAAGDDANKTNAIIEIMGSRAGANLIPLISNLEGLKAEMAGVAVASDEAVRRIEEANDRMTRLGNTLKVFFAENVLGALTDASERIGSLLAKIQASPMEFAQKISKAFGGVLTGNLFPLQDLMGEGQTIAEIEAEELRQNAIGRLRARGDFAASLSETGIKAEMDAIKAKEKEIADATKLRASASEEIDQQLSGQREQRTKILELGLQIKEAEAAGNKALADKLRYQEDIEKGILKYKDAEDAYGMAVREANAELAKRNELLKGKDSTGSEFEQVRAKYIASLSKFTFDKTPEELKADQENTRRYFELTRLNPELLNVGGAASRMANSAALTEPERQRAEAATRSATPGTATEADKIATETTLQKVANFLEQLNTKLPQPVLV